MSFSTYLLLDELVANIEYCLDWVLIHAYRLVVVGDLAWHILLIEIQMLWEGKEGIASQLTLK